MSDSNNEFLGRTLSKLADRQAVWSQKTFGLDRDRGPIGPLKHLQKEAQEAIEAPNNLDEYADCLLLVMDATRRAGFSITDLLIQATRKQSINEQRSWPASEPDQPVFHEVHQ